MILRNGCVHYDCTEKHDDRSIQGNIKGNFYLVENNIFENLTLRRNGTPPLFDVLPFEINIENYFLLIGSICTLYGNFPRSSVG